MTTIAESPGEARPTPDSRNTFWNRQLSHYPSNGSRYLYLGITVLATIVLYYELYVQGAVATQIIHDLDCSFAFYVSISIVGNAVGACASIFAGLADRWGRANMVIYGLLITGLIIGFGLPHMSDKWAFMALFAVLSFVEGIVLVATPALIRDFSPQIGRASAMSFWTLGPVLGSLCVTMVSSNTLDAHPNWRFQFYVCGIAGLVVFVIAFLLLKELSPGLRDQLMVTHRERALIEARAVGLDTEQALSGHWKQMMKADIIGPAFAISIFLIFYYVAVGFFVVYLATVFGYSLARANALGNWYWITNAIALVIAGVLSDKLRVRKPFMVLGAVVSAAAVAVWATKATQADDTSYYTLAVIIIFIAAGSGVAYCAWMAAFTETVEKHNPAATATGLAVWGGILRAVVTVTLIALTFVLGATSTLVDKGAKVQDLANEYHAELATAAKISPDHLAALTTSPDSPAAQAAALSDISGVPVAQVAVIAAASVRYKDEIATAQTVSKADPTALPALTANPTSPAAQVKAIAALTGLPAADVAGVLTASVQYPEQLATAAAVDPAVLAKLQGNPVDPTTAAQAVGQIQAKLGVDAATATARLQALALVPPATSALVLKDGAQVKAAGEKLTALGKVPPATLALLAASGDKITAAAAELKALGAVPDEDLAYLKANATAVQDAQKEVGEQWQTWWWICFAAQVLFIPFIFLLTGRWSPGKARQDQAEHDARIDEELRALSKPTASGGSPATT